MMVGLLSVFVFPSASPELTVTTVVIMGLTVNAMRGAKEIPWPVIRRNEVSVICKLCAVTAHPGLNVDGLHLCYSCLRWLLIQSTQLQSAAPTQDGRRLSQGSFSVNRALDFVQLVVVLEGFLGWAGGNLSMMSDLSHVTVACDDGSIQEHSRTKGKWLQKEY